ncbi:MAG TPA: DNA polymerase ligase N-terminal domain-containing protein [Thermodesulfobacteriota bacterium]|nr:DNA polymerase ligase N-terminal domain-containing protein [Thermodesulfobacteriota bacterium]
MSGMQLRFIIQNHKTNHPHFDLSLEIDGARMTWILPKRVPIKGREIRLAIKDKAERPSSFDYNTVVDDGYGMGEAEVWDTGTYEITSKNKSKIEFEAKGEKFAGKFILLLPSWGRWYKKRLWTLIKI